MKAIPNIFATQPAGNVPASYLDVDFALIADAGTFSNYFVDTGAENAYVVTFATGETGSLSAGLSIQFKASADNTGASTLAVNGMTAKNITNYDASALAAGQIKTGAVVSVMYDGTQFKLVGQFTGGPIISANMVESASAPAPPASGQLQLWSKTDGTLHIQNSSAVDQVLAILGAQTFTGLQTFSAGIEMGTQHISYGGTAAGLSFDSSNNATFSANLSATGTLGTSNDLLSAGALATTATTGFVYIPSCAGPPTGVPTQSSSAGRPVIFDSTNNYLYVYNGGWKKTTVFA